MKIKSEHTELQVERIAVGRWTLLHLPISVVMSLVFGLRQSSQGAHVIVEDLLLFGLFGTGLCCGLIALQAMLLNLLFKIFKGGPLFRVRIETVKEYDI